MNRGFAIKRGKLFVTGTLGPVGKHLMTIGAGMLAFILPAIDQHSELRHELAAVKQAATGNKQSLKKYQWMETTQLMLEGEPKPTSQKLSWNSL
jgi:hypothetical protein